MIAWAVALLGLLLSTAAGAYETWSMPPVVLVVSGSNFTPDCSVNGYSFNFIVTLTANSQVLANPVNCPVGASIVVTINQDAVTPRTGFSTGTQYKFSGGVAPPWSQAISKKDVVSCNADTSTTFNCSASIASGG